MHFKLDLTVRELQIDKDLVEIEYGGKHNITIVFRKPTEEEQSVGHSELSPFCEASGEWNPKDKILKGFSAIASNTLPKGCKLQEEWSVYGIDEDGNFKGRMYLPLRILPDPFESFVRQVNDDLNDYAKRTVNLLRWRCGTQGYHNPISWRGATWTIDGANWFPMPSSSRAHFSLHPHVYTTEDILNEVKGYVKENKNFPLGYELFLEAWSQRLQNPRSSVIVGIAAVETAFKLCISNFVPDAKWLIENSASPDLVKMLSEYLPDLPTVNKVSRKIFERNSHLHSTLTKGVQMRNQLVHGRPTSLTHDNVEEILIAVCDVLWIIDYCSGYNWALKHISQETKQLLEV
jgi:hypothetical protein